MSVNAIALQLLQIGRYPDRDFSRQAGKVVPLKLRKVDMSIPFTAEEPMEALTLKEPGFLDPSHSRGDGFRPPPLRSRKPIDETSSVWY